MKEKSKEELVYLLNNGKIDEFNQYRIDTDNEPINLILVDLKSAKLKCVNLSNTYLTHADLKNADLRYANLNHANLSFSDLRYADLSNADLSNANLWDTIGNKEEIITLQTPHYTCNFTKDVLWVGCHGKHYDEWFGLSEEEINKLDSKALDFYHEWKDKLVIFKNIFIGE